MPIVFGVIGVLLIVTGVRGTVYGSSPSLVSLVEADLTGTPNYLEWMAAIFVVGALGYIPQLRTLSRLFMTIIVIDLFFANRGFFAQLTQEFSSQGAAPAPVSVQSAGLSTSQTAAAAGTGLSALSALPGLSSIPFPSF